MTNKEKECLKLIKEICEGGSCQDCVFSNKNGDFHLCGLELETMNDEIPYDWDLNNL